MKMTSSEKECVYRKNSPLDVFIHLLFSSFFKAYLRHWKFRFE